MIKPSLAKEVVDEVGMEGDLILVVVDSIQPLDIAQIRDKAFITMTKTTQLMLPTNKKRLYAKYAVYSITQPWSVGTDLITHINLKTTSKRHLQPWQ